MFQSVFTKLAGGEETINVERYTDYLREFTKNSRGSIMNIILQEMEAEGPVLVDFAGFLNLLEYKVGSLQTTQGLK